MHTKKFWNKALSLLLAVVLSFTLIIPTASFAADEDYDSGEAVTEEVTVEAVEEPEAEQISEDGSAEEVEADAIDMAEVPMDYETAEAVFVPVSEDGIMTMSTGDITGATVQYITDGTAPFDSNNDAGNDADDSNKIVRTYDTVVYAVDFETYNSDGEIKVQVDLPLSSDEASFDLSSMIWAEDSVITDNGGSQTLTATRTLGNTGSVSATLNIFIQIKNAANGKAFAPTITLSTDTSSVQADGDSIPNVTVSGAEKYAVKIGGFSQGSNATWDLNQGTSADKGTDWVSGNSSIYGQSSDGTVALAAVNDSADKGLKGLIFPTGDVTFTIDFSESAYDSNGNQVASSTTNSWTPVLWDYMELQRATTGNWGRTYLASSISGVATGSTVSGDDAGPYNRIGICSEANATNSCYDGGSWTIIQTGNTSYKVTIKGEAIDYENMVFPIQSANSGADGYDGKTFYISSAFLEGIMQFPESVDDNTTVYYGVSTSDLTINGESKSNTQYESVNNSRTLKPAGDLDNTVTFTLPYDYSDDDYATNHNIWNWLSSSRTAPDAFTTAGSTVRLWNHCERYNYSETIRTAVMVLRWDADYLEVDTSRGANGNSMVCSYDSGTIYSYDVYFMAKDSNWSDSIDMSTHYLCSSDVTYYKNLSDIPSGKVCVGCIFVSDIAFLVGYYPTAFIDLKVKASTPSDTVVAVNGENWDSFSAVKDSIINNNGDGTYSVNKSAVDASSTVHQWGYYGPKSNYEAMGWSGDWLDSYHFVMNGYNKLVWTNNWNQQEGTANLNSYAGNSLTVLNEKASVSITSSIDTVDLTSQSNEVTYTVSPRVDVNIGSYTDIDLTHSTNATVTVTLPAEVTYKGNAIWNGFSITPDEENNDDGTTTLTFTLNGLTAGESIGDITFDAEISKATPDNTQLVAEATIISDGDQRAANADWGNLYDDIIYVSNLAETFIVKYVDSPEIEVNGDITWQLDIGNATVEDDTSTRIADVLPYNGDGRGSDFHGGYTVNSIVIDMLEAPSSFSDDISSMHIYGTTDRVTMTCEEIVQNQAGTVGSWTDLTSFASVDSTNRIITITGSEIANLTAIDIDFGNLDGAEFVSVYISTTTYDNFGEDIYYNDFALEAEGWDTDIVAPVVVTVVPEVEPDVAITKVADNDWYNVHDIVTYTFEVTETVPGGIAEDLTVTDIFEDGLMLTEDVGGDYDFETTVTISGVSGGQSSYEGQTLIVTIPELRYGETATITVTVKIDSSLIGTEVPNEVTVIDGDGHTGTDDYPIEVLEPELVIVKDADKEDYSLYEEVHYTITVNQIVKDAIAFNVVVTDTIPEELRLDDVVAYDFNRDQIADEHLDIDYDGNCFTLHAGNMNYNEPVTIDVTCTAIAEGEMIYNTATATADYIPPVDDDVPVNSREPVLAVEKDADATRYYPEDVVTYTITGTSLIPLTDAYNAVISDTLPEGLTLVDVEYESGMEPTDIYGEDGELIAEAIEIDYETNSFAAHYDVFPYGVETVLTVTATADTEYANTGEIENMVTFDADNAEPVTDTAVIEIIQPLLAIEKTSDKDVYSRGEDVIYTIDLTETVPDVPAYDVVLSDTMPDGVHIKNVTVDGANAIVKFLDGTETGEDTDTEEPVESEEPDVIDSNENAEVEEDWYDALMEELAYAYDILEGGLPDADSEKLLGAIDLTLAMLEDDDLTDYDYMGAYNTLVDVIAEIAGVEEDVVTDSETCDHNWQISFTFSEDCSEATATFECLKCGEVVELACELTSEDNDLGGLTYTASVVFNDRVYSDTFVYDSEGFAYTGDITSKSVTTASDENDVRTHTSEPEPEGGYTFTVEGNVTDSFEIYFDYLNPNQHAIITVEAVADEAGEFVNMAYADSPQTPPVQDDTPIEVLEPDLAIVKTVNNETPNVGETVTWTINVNETIADIAAYNVYISDTMPEGLTIVGTPTVSGVEGEVTVDGQLVYVTVPVLNYGETITVDIQTTVEQQLEGMSALNIAYTGADYVDEISDDASITVPVPVVAVSEPGGTTTQGPKTGEIIAFWSVVAAALAAAVVAVVTVLRRKRMNG